MEQITIEDITKNWLKQCYEAPLPEGYELRFGISGCKFKKYANLQELENAHMEFDGKNMSPFGYCDPKYPERKNKFLPTDEFLLVNDNIVYVIRNEEVITKDYKSRHTNEIKKQPDPDFFIELDAL